MMGRQIVQEQLFYSFRLEDHIPANHLLRQLDRILNFDRVRSVLASHYSSTGRPSIDPELMLRILLIGYAYGIRSEVKRYFYDTHNQFKAHLGDFLRAYNFARRLKALKGLTPYQYLCKLWTQTPDQFILNPIHQMPGLNT